MQAAVTGEYCYFEWMILWETKKIVIFIEMYAFYVHWNDILSVWKDNGPGFENVTSWRDIVQKCIQWMYNGYFGKLAFVIAVNGAMIVTFKGGQMELKFTM